MLDRDGWEGLYKFNPATNTTIKIPFVFNRSKRLWLLNYSTGDSNAEAKQRAMNNTESIQAVWNDVGDTGHVPVISDRSNDLPFHSVLAGIRIISRYTYILVYLLIYMGIY